MPEGIEYTDLEANCKTTKSNTGLQEKKSKNASFNGNLVTEVLYRHLRFEIEAKT